MDYLKSHLTVLPLKGLAHLCPDHPLLDVLAIMDHVSTGHVFAVVVNHCPCAREAGVNSYVDHESLDW
jgi:hypothetical protein